MNTALQKAVEVVGSQVALAAALGVRQGHVWKWLNTAVEGVPAKYCPSIERVTGGKVRCEELRPDVDWAYLRGTCSAEHHEAA
jgi:DNA-binding transcriptional regulator YdaS (Cro superfamily)